MLTIISIFVAISISMESIGVWARVVGAKNEQPTIGYSTHVRIATLGRFFVLQRVFQVLPQLPLLNLILGIRYCLGSYYYLLS